MSLSEQLLLALSHPPERVPTPHAGEDDAWTPENALSLLRRTIPANHLVFAGQRVLDFGCGTGQQTLALAREGATHVCGVDINAALLETARTLAAQAPEGDRVSFVLGAESLPDGSFDMILSQNSMEHFPDPVGVLRTMRRLLRPGGRVLITFGPPWFAPYGSHMHFFTRVPWVQLLFPERTVMRVRSRFRDDGATRYEDVVGGLNRMSVGKFERLVASCGLRPLYRRYECVKGLDALGHVPVVRELFVNHITCVLTT